MAIDRARDHLVDLDVAYVPTPKEIVRQMLQLASLKRGELLYDLGAGDGRIIIEAVRHFGARAVGVEIDPKRIARIRERLTATRTSAELIAGDFFKIDLSNADVVALYLSPSVNTKLAPKLSGELMPGTRVVSLDYELPGWTTDRILETEASGVNRTLFLYRRR